MDTAIVEVSGATLEDDGAPPDAVILAGGLGTRLRSVVPHLPKVLAPVGGQPFLEILLELMNRKGFRRIVLALGYMAETVLTKFGSRFRDIELCYEVEESPLGTGGATYRALKRCRGDHAFVVNGDTYLDLEKEYTRVPMAARTGADNCCMSGHTYCSLWPNRITGWRGA